MNSKSMERALAALLFWAAAAAITYVFWWMDKGAGDGNALVNSTNFSAVFAYWGLFFTFYIGLFLGMGGGECFSCTLEGATTSFSPDVLRKAAGTAIAFIGTAVSVALTTHLAKYAGPEGAVGLNFAGTQVLSLLPLHWGFVWLVFVQHIGLV